MEGMKTGGRQKGTPNKITADIREKLGGVVHSQLVKIIESDSEWVGLPLEARIKLLEKLLPYVLPRVAADE